MNHLKLLLLLLFFSQIAFCQKIYPAKLVIREGNLPIIIWTGDTLTGLSNPQIQDINLTYLDRDKCYESLSIEKTYSAGKDSVNMLGKILQANSDKTDSIFSVAIKQYNKLSDIQDAKFKDVNDSWKVYAKDLKKQNRKNIFSTIFTTVPITLTLAILAIVYLKH